MQMPNPYIYQGNNVYANDEANFAGNTTDESFLMYGYENGL